MSVSSELIWRDSLMLTKPLLISSLAVALFAASARADSFAYVVTDSDQFGTVDLNTGAFHQIGADTSGQQFDLVPGPNGSLLSLTATGNLESINPANGETSVIGATGLGFNVASLAEVGGALYLTDGNNNLYTVNATTGAAHLIGPTGIPPLIFNPPTVSDESLYGVGGKLYATSDVFNLPVLSPVLVTPPALYQIDPVTGVATKVGPTMLGLSASVDVNGVFYAFHEGLADPSCVGAAPSPCRSDAEVFTLDLANGNTSFVTDVSPGATAIYGAAPVPEPAPVALAGLGIAALVALARRRRGELKFEPE
jgi:outer membrane protein assembly factor BamB